MARWDNIFYEIITEIMHNSLGKTRIYSLRNFPVAPTPYRQSSFSVIHKFGDIDIFVLLKIENKLDVAISQMNFISKQYDKCKFVLKFVSLVTIPEFISIEVVKNSSGDLETLLTM